jgi:hypothetical protein
MDENVVNESQVTTETPEMETVTNGDSVTETPVPGSKTDSELLLKSLQEERERRRELENRLKAIESPSSTDDFSGDGVEQKVTELEKTIESMKAERNLEKVFTLHPELKDAEADFKQFASDYPQDKLESVAKIFLVEKGLMGKPVRKGLEKPTGGGKTVPQSGITTEEMADLRKNNYKKYIELLNSGKIQPRDIK